jgi:hypothetical protein
LFCEFRLVLSNRVAEATTSLKCFREATQQATLILRSGRDNAEPKLEVGSLPIQNMGRVRVHRHCQGVNRRSVHRLQVF